MIGKLLDNQVRFQTDKNDCHIILFLSFYCIIFYIFVAKYQMD